MIEAEREAETARIVERVAREDTLDLEAAECYIRSAVLAVGARVLEQLLHNVGVGPQERPRLCAHQHPPRVMESTGVRAKTIHSILGPVRYERSRLRCSQCGAVAYPGDALLGVEGTGFSPGLRRLMTRAGSRESFGEAAADLHVYAGVQVDPKDVERVAQTTGRQIEDWMRRQGAAAVLRQGAPDQDEPPIPILYIALDGTGAPMRPAELEGVRGKAQDGRARTREVKLGCVFTQTTLDPKGRPVRDPHSTTYVGAIEESTDFGHRLHQEAVRRGLGRAQKVAVLSDGAEYNATITREHFPGATHILDLCHAAQRLSDFVKAHTVHPCQGPFHLECFALMEEGRIEQLLERMHQALARGGQRRRQGLKATHYFAQRIEQMRYGEFRRQGLFVGSGVIEAGCKTVIGKRLKQSGMFWSVAGANAIIAARCCLYSDRFEQFWEDTGS